MTWPRKRNSLTKAARSGVSKPSGQEQIAMDFRFFADVATYTVDDGIHVVGFADRDPPISYVILQRGVEDDEQDQALGHDTYYMEVCENGVVGYGGVESVSWRGEMLNIELAPDAAWAEGLGLVTIVVRATDGLEQVKQGLAAIFSGTPTRLRVD
ncbi:Imm10 family immunity protein [Burkholderia lata]|uniref:Imm10 family immunity protein n=1 Tax=Burkholderia lata (strain ATCC 17760 / DSM 23089 / LMG 22485 / NCIMB 9086 / R18194 / 383) TaxID=482957 RepID=UPI00158408BA|nr:Imm10 family immunity protein [Burkholderia lata]